ncbi:MAG: glycogen/starch synthase [Francisella endosymbiont of Hyalomma asiaticum]
MKVSEIATWIKTVKNVFTIHNLAYQGLFPLSVSRFA